MGIKQTTDKQKKKNNHIRVHNSKVRYKKVMLNYLLVMAGMCLKVETMETSYPSYSRDLNVYLVHTINYVIKLNNLDLPLFSEVDSFDGPFPSLSHVLQELLPL